MDVDRVQRALPAWGPPGASFTGEVEGRQGEIEAFQRGLLVKTILLISRVPFAVMPQTVSMGLFATGPSRS